jgi:DNA-binding transcriptional MerR regulator/methylmalonyl-CoA mutase cobalamin-binding subunit
MCQVPDAMLDELSLRMDGQNMDKLPKRRVAPAKPTKVAPKTTAENGAFSIRVVSRMTGIEPDTLRVWERRYGFPKPERTPGGARVYSERDVTTLKLVSAALRAGYRPSEVLGRASADIEKLTEASLAPRAVPGSAPSVEALLEALEREDVGALRAHLKRAGILCGPLRFVVDFAWPAAIEVGARWERGELEVHHEHLFTECLSSQLQLMLSAFDDAIRGPSVLLATLPGELHGLGLEMIALYLGARGLAPRILGVNTPAPQIAAAAKALKSDAVGLAVVAPVDKRTTLKQLRSIRAELPKRAPLWLGGVGARAFEGALEGLTVVGGWEQLDRVADELRGGEQ